jgi:hypothetical protein
LNSNPVRRSFTGDNEGDPEAGGVHSSASWKAGIRQKRHPVLYQRFILLLGMFLGSYVPMAGQTPAPQIVLAQEHILPSIANLLFFLCLFKIKKIYYRFISIFISFHFFEKKKNNPLNLQKLGL